MTESTARGDREVSSLTRGVSEVGAMGDRLLVGLLGHLLREVAVIRDSASAALRTTVRVVRSMHTGGEPTASPLAGEAEQAEMQSPEARAADPEPKHVMAPATWAHAPAPAGVVPALEALAKIVSQHVETGGGGLQSDTRFWGLVALLQSLTVAGPPGESTAEGGH